MSREACPAGFPLWIFIWTRSTDVPLRSTERSRFEWVPQPPLPWTLYPEGRLQRFFPASQGMCAFTVWTSYISEFSPTSFQVYNACVFLCSRSVNPRLIGRCIMKTLKKTWGSSALGAAPGLENAARETCTAVSKIFETRAHIPSSFHCLYLLISCPHTRDMAETWRHVFDGNSCWFSAFGISLVPQRQMRLRGYSVSLHIWFDLITFKLLGLIFLITTLISL